MHDFFCQFQPGVIWKSVAYKKIRIDLKFTYKIIIFKWFLNYYYWLFPISFQESLPKRHNAIDSCAMFKHGFIFKINKDSFNFKWKSLTAVPTISKLSTLQQCLFSWQCFLIAVASFSVYFNVFSVKTDKTKCSYWRTNRCRLVLPM